MPVSVMPLNQRVSRDPLFALSIRELEVLRLIAQGYSNAGIAGELFLGVKTVETHVGSIFRKLGLPENGHVNRRVLAALAHLMARGNAGRAAA